jgi:drug/metabolite transporter (DMT)-like permease
VFKSASSHWTAVGQALLVTFLWSTSYVLVKIGLVEIPAITFAGLRYFLAFLVLLPFFFRQGQAATLRTLTRQDWVRLAVLGLLFYAITQGTNFVGLSYLPTVTVSLLLSFSPVVVALLGILILREQPRWRQWLGIGLCMIGAFLYFYPLVLPYGQAIGIAIVLLGVLANAFSSILGREVNRAGNIPPLTVTVVSMGIGALVLLVSGLALQGLPQLSLTNWAIILWLAVVNTAFAFTLWNHTLRTLSAMESTVINNTMLIQIAVLAWLFLGESLSGQEIVGMVVAAVGAFLVQLRNK